MKLDRSDVIQAYQRWIKFFRRQSSSGALTSDQIAPVHPRHFGSSVHMAPMGLLGLNDGHAEQEHLAGPRTPEVVILRSLINSEGHFAAILNGDGESRLTLLLNHVLPVHSVYSLERAKQSSSTPKGAVYRVRHCRAGSRPGEARLGHVLHVLERMHPDTHVVPGAGGQSIGESALTSSDKSTGCNGHSPTRSITPDPPSIERDMP